MSVRSYLVDYYARENNLKKEDVIESIKAGKFDGKQVGDLWYIKFDDEAEILDKGANKIIQSQRGPILTTSMFVAKRVIEREVGVIGSECVYGMNIFKDFLAGVRDIAGGRSEATQKVFHDARKTVLSDLRKQAHSLGADAVIALNIEYAELSGGGKNGMLLVAATGTAVKLKSLEMAGENDNLDPIK